MSFFVSKLRWFAKGESGAAATLQTIFSRLFMLTLNLANGIITARFLGPEGRGIQTAIIFWPGMLASTFTLGLPTSIVYNFGRHPKKKEELFLSAIILSLFLGISASLSGYIFLPYVLSKYSETTVRFAQNTIFLTIANLLFLILNGALEGIQKFTFSNKARALVPALTFISLVLLLITKNLNAYSSSLAYLTTYVPIVSWLFVVLWKKLKPRFRNLFLSSKLLIDYGYRSYGITLFAAVSSQVNQAIVISALSPSDMGLFAIAISFSNMLHIFRISIVTVLFPKVAAQEEEEEAIEITSQATRICAALTLAAGLTAILIAPQLVRLLYGSEFLAAVVLFRISVLEVLLISITLVLSQVFLSLNKPGVITILQMVGLGAGIPLRLFFIPAYGLVGAGIAILFSTAIRFIFVMACFPIILHRKPPNLLINRSDILYLKNVLLKSA